MKVIQPPSRFRLSFPFQLKFAADGGIAVDSEMRTGVPNVYAAGDVCTVQWDSQPAHWFPVSQYTFLCLAHMLDI